MWYIRNHQTKQPRPRSEHSTFVAQSSVNLYTRKSCKTSAPSDPICNSLHINHLTAEQMGADRRVAIWLTVENGPHLDNRSDKKNFFLSLFYYLMLLYRAFFVTLPPNLSMTKKMKPSDFIHPEDAAALRQMEGIPSFAALVKKILAIGIEDLQYGVNMVSTIRLSERQLSKIYRHLLSQALISSAPTAAPRPMAPPSSARSAGRS